ncbi:hypothetical protein C0J52_24554 [Blattella germanica]|nr:hypothetical protein C0J52_24554 [Blattella germanica]
MELEKELLDMKIDIATITETKKKLKGSQELDKYIMIYNGVEQNQRASAGVAIMINKALKTKIHSYTFVNERIVLARLRVERGFITIVAAYSPGDGRSRETDKFYKKLQETIHKINKNDYLILAGDMNGRVGNMPVKDVLGTNGESTINENGKKLIDFASFNNLVSERGSQTIIDYIITNRKNFQLHSRYKSFPGM